MPATTTTFQFRSPAFQHNARIPKRHTEDGEDLSPRLTWSGLPQGTRELVLIVDDPDAPRPQPWVHWTMYKIPAATDGLPEGLPPNDRLDAPSGAIQGKNTWDTLGYRGPAPPKDHGTHHYRFHLYALDEPLNLDSGATKDVLLQAIDGHILGEAELVGTYER